MERPDERSDARERALYLLYEAHSKGIAPAATIELQVIEPDGTEHEPVPVTEEEQGMTLPGQSGLWSVVVTGEGGCEQEDFTLQLSSFSQLLGRGALAWLIGPLLLAIGILGLGRRRRRAAGSTGPAR